MSEFLPILTAFLNSASTENIKALIFSPNFAEAVNDEFIVNIVRNYPNLLEEEDFLQNFKQHIRNLIHEDKNGKISKLLKDFEDHNMKTYEMKVTSFKLENEEPQTNIPYHALFPPQFSAKEFTIFANIKYSVRVFPTSTVEGVSFYNYSSLSRSVQYSFLIFIEGLFDQNFDRSDVFPLMSVLSALDLEYINPLDDCVRIEERNDPETGRKEKCYVIDTNTALWKIAENYNSYVVRNRFSEFLGLAYRENNGTILVPEFFKDTIKREILESGTRRRSEFSSSIFFNDDYETKREGLKSGIDEAVKLINKAGQEIYKPNEQAPFNVKIRDNESPTRAYERMLNFFRNHPEFTTSASTAFQKAFKWKNVNIMLSFVYKYMGGGTPAEEIKSFRDSIVASQRDFGPGRRQLPWGYSFKNNRIYPYGSFYLTPQTFDTHDTKLYSIESLACQYSEFVFERIIPYPKMVILKSNSQNSLICYIARYPENTNLQLDPNSPTPVEVHTIDRRRSFFLMRSEDGIPLFTDVRITLTLFQDFQKEISKPDVGFANLSNFDNLNNVNVYAVIPKSEGKLIVSPGNTIRFQIESLNLSEKPRRLSELFYTDEIMEYPEFINLMMRRISASENDAEEFSEIFRMDAIGWAKDFISLFLSSISKPIRTHNVSIIDSDLISTINIRGGKFLEKTIQNLINSNISNKIEKDILQELKSRREPIDETIIRNSNVYAIAKSQIDSFSNLRNTQITCSNIFAQSQVADSSIFAMFLSVIFEFLNREINEQDVRNALDLNNITNYEIIDCGQVFVLCEMNIDIETNDFSIKRFTGEQPIKQNTPGNELMDVFFRIGISRDRNLSEIINVINTYARYENLFTGEIFPISRNDIEIDSSERNLGIHYHVCHCPYSKNGASLIVRKLSEREESFSFDLLTKAAYILYKKGSEDILRNCIDDMSKDSFLYSLIAGINAPNISIDEENSMIFLNVSEFNENLDYGKLNILIIPTTIYSPYSFSGNKQILEMNKKAAIDFTNNPQIAELINALDISPIDVIDSLKFLPEDINAKEFLAISNVKKDNGTISTETLGISTGIQNLEIGESISYLSERKFQKTSESLENSETFLYSMYDSYLYLKTISEQKKHEDALNSVKYALSTLSSNKISENSVDVSGKVFWTKISKDKHFYAVGLQNYVLVYIFVSGKFFQISALFHDDVMDICFGNKLYCTTFSENETKLWIMYTGTQIDIFIPPVEFSVGDVVNGVIMSNKHGQHSITRVNYVKYREGNYPNEAPLNSVKDADFYLKYKRVYFHLNNEIKNIKSKLNFNTFFFSNNDTYLVFNGGGTLKLIDMSTMNEIPFANRNGMKPSEAIPVPISGQWDSNSKFVGVSALKSEIVVDPKTRSVNVFQTPGGSNDYYPITLFNGEIKYSQRSEFISLIQNIEDDFFWIYDMLVFVERNTASLTFLFVLKNRVLGINIAVVKNENIEMENGIRKNGNQYTAYNVTSPVQLFMKNFVPIMDGHNVQNITINGIPILSHYESKDFTHPIIKMKNHTLFVQGDSNIVVTHNYFRLEEENLDYTVIDVKGKYRTVNYLVSGNVSPIYDTIMKEFYILSVDDGILKFVKIETLENVLNNESNAERPGLIVTRKYPKHSNVEALVYNKICKVKYNKLKTGEVPVKTSIDNQPISKFLSMNRFENFSYADIADYDGLTFGNLKMKIDRNKLIISPRYIHVNEDYNVFLYWVVEKYGNKSHDEIREFFKNVLKIKRNLQESFPFLFFNVKANFKMTKDELVNANPEIKTDKALYKLMEVLFKDVDFYEYLFGEFAKVEKTEKEKMKVTEASIQILKTEIGRKEAEIQIKEDDISDIVNQISKNNKKIAENEAKIAENQTGKKVKGKKSKPDPRQNESLAKANEELREENKSKNDEIEKIKHDIVVLQNAVNENEEKIDKLESINVEELIQASLEEVNVTVQKLSKILDEIPFPSLREYNAFKVLKNSQNFNNITNPDANMLLLPKQLFDYDGGYKILDGTFKSYITYKTIISEIEKLQSSLKTLLKEESNYDKYSNMTLQTLKMKIRDLKMRYFSMTDKFLVVLGKPAKQVALDAKKELLVHASDEKAEEEAQYFKTLVEKLIFGDNSKTNQESILVSQYADNIKSLAKQRKSFLKGVIKNELQVAEEIVMKIKQTKEKFSKDIQSVLSKVPDLYKTSFRYVGDKTEFEESLVRYDGNYNKIKLEIIHLYEEIFNTNIEYGIDEFIGKITDLIDEIYQIKEDKVKEIFLSKLEFLTVGINDYLATMNDLEKQKESIDYNAETLSLFEKGSSFDEVVITICKMDNLSIGEKLLHLELISRFEGKQTNRKIELKGPQDYLEITNTVNSILVNEYIRTNASNLYGYEHQEYDWYLVHYKRYAVLKTKQFCNEYILYLEDKILNDSQEEYQDSVSFTDIERATKNSFLLMSKGLDIYTSNTIGNMYDYDLWLMQEAFYRMFLMLKYMFNEEGKQVSVSVFKEIINFAEKVIGEAFCEPIYSFIEKNDETLKNLVSKLPRSIRDKLNELKNKLDGSVISFKELEERVMDSVMEKLMRISTSRMENIGEPPNFDEDELISFLETKSTPIDIKTSKTLRFFEEYDLLISIKEELMETYEIEGDSHVRSLDSIIDEATNYSTDISQCDLYDKLNWYRLNGIRENPKNLEKYRDYHVRSIVRKMERLKAMEKNGEYFNIQSKLSNQAEKFLLNIMKQYQNADSDNLGDSMVNQIILEFPEEIEFDQEESKDQESEFALVKLCMKIPESLESVGHLSKVTVNLRDIFENVWKQKRLSSTYFELSKRGLKKYEKAEFTKVEEKYYEQSGAYGYVYENFKNVFEKVILSKVSISNENIIVTNYNAIDFGDQLIKRVSVSYEDERDESVTSFYKQVKDFDYEGLVQQSEVRIFDGVALIKGSKFSVKTMKVENPEKAKPLPTKGKVPEKIQSVTMICLQNVENGERKIYLTNKEVQLNNVEDAMKNIGTVSYNEAPKQVEIERQKVFKRDGKIFVISWYKRGSIKGTYIKFQDKVLDFRNFIIKDISVLFNKLWIVGLNQNSESYIVRCGIIDISKINRSYIFNNFDIEYDLNIRITDEKLVKFADGELKALAISGEMKIQNTKRPINTVVVFRNKANKVELKERIIDITSAKTGKFFTAICKNGSVLLNYAGEIIREIDGEAFLI